MDNEIKNGIIEFSMMSATASAACLTGFLGIVVSSFVSQGLGSTEEATTALGLTGFLLGFTPTVLSGAYLTDWLTTPKKDCIAMKVSLLRKAIEFLKIKIISSGAGRMSESGTAELQSFDSVVGKLDVLPRDGILLQELSSDHLYFISSSDWSKVKRSLHRVIEVHSTQEPARSTDYLGQLVVLENSSRRLRRMEVDEFLLEINSSLTQKNQDTLREDLEGDRSNVTFR